MSVIYTGAPHLKFALVPMNSLGGLEGNSCLLRLIQQFTHDTAASYLACTIDNRYSCLLLPRPIYVGMLWF